MDFTFTALGNLLRTCIDSGFCFSPVKDYSASGNKDGGRVIIMRHDVDRRPDNSLACARLENKLGITGTYYFRITPDSFDRKTILEIASLGHEIGYHYEDLDIVARRSRTRCGNRGYQLDEELSGEAFESFRENLQKIREVAPVVTACMHGSPMSRHDSRHIWKYFDYSRLGIECEPYFDIVLDDILYLTDTGRRWDGVSVSVRDRLYARSDEYYEAWTRKPVTGSAMAASGRGISFNSRLRFRSTNDIIRALRINSLHDRLFITIHPQRWSMDTFQWFQELTGQKLKNIAKYFIAEMQFR